MTAMGGAAFSNRIGGDDVRRVKMSRSMKLAIAFLAFASMAGSVANAGERDERRGEGMRGEHMMRFERADEDNSGDVTFEEFAAVFGSRLDGVDANDDGKMTVDEIADKLERMRYERMARRLVRRFDTDGDGALTPAEVESRQKKLFAFLDRDENGAIEKDELPRRGWGGFQHRFRD